MTSTDSTRSTESKTTDRILVKLISNLFLFFLSRANIGAVERSIFWTRLCSAFFLSFFLFFLPEKQDWDSMWFWCFVTEPGELLLLSCSTCCAVLLSRLNRGGEFCIRVCLVFLFLGDRPSIVSRRQGRRAGLRPAIGPQRPCQPAMASPFGSLPL